MKRTFVVYLLVGAAAGIGCGDATGVTADELAGAWSATQYEFTNPATASQQVDIIAMGGSFSISFMASGDFTANFQEPGEQLETISGTISVGGDTLTISESGQGSPTDFVASRSGSTLTLTTSDEEYDFDGDDVEEPASLRIILRKM